MLNNIWYNITEWFNERSERNSLMSNFNRAARDAFISGVAPTMLKASVSRGESSYKHQFSAWLGSGFRVQALSGIPLSKEEMVFIGKVVLNNTELVRRLVVLGWDTLEVHDDKGLYGCRWKLSDYAQIGLSLNQ